MSALALDDVYAGYTGTDVLRGVSFAVEPGERVAVIGPNGAGKSTLLRALSGQIRLRQGRRSVAGVDTTRWPIHRIARAGVRWVGEPRPIYPGLTVGQNLEVGGLTGRQGLDTRFRYVYALLPALYDKRHDRAGTLSGGQQQMLAIGQALMSEPRYLCLDEPSLGLAPHVINTVANVIVELAESGVGIVWAEQFPGVAIPRCTWAVVLRGGAVIESSPASELDEVRLERAYLGEAAPNRSVTRGLVTE